jgi:prepilin signal peptidase PulO-like enzyme (type II secretory pathway)
MFFIFFILGLIFGSFINVLVYRLNLAENFTTGRSKCPHCKEIIRWYDNIPLLSFIILKFRCRNCREKISYQYPLVEFFTGAIFALIGRSFFSAADAGTWAATIYYLGIASALIAIFVYDFLYMEIPGLVLWPAVGWAVAFNLLLDWNRTDLGNNIFNSLTFSGTLAAFAAFIFFFLMVAVSREKWMGMGDAYLVILLGLVSGWPQILLALMLAFAIGAIFGLVLIALKKKKMESQIPFAPFLVLGTVISLLFYNGIVAWYFKLFY